MTYVKQRPWESYITYGIYTFPVNVYGVFTLCFHSHSHILAFCKCGMKLSHFINILLKPRGYLVAAFPYKWQLWYLLSVQLMSTYSKKKCCKEVCWKKDLMEINHMLMILWPNSSYDDWVTYSFAELKWTLKAWNDLREITSTSSYKRAKDSTV